MDAWSTMCIMQLLLQAPATQPTQVTFCTQYCVIGDIIQNMNVIRIKMLKLMIHKLQWKQVQYDIIAFMMIKGGTHLETYDGE